MIEELREEEIVKKVGGRFKLGLPIWYLIYKFRAKDSQAPLP